MAHIDDAQNSRRTLEEWLSRKPVICGRCGNTAPMGLTRIVEEPIERTGPVFYGQATVKEIRVCGNC